MKYLLLFVLLVVVWSIWKKRNDTAKPDDLNQNPLAPENMLLCAYCGVHLPESDSVLDGERVFCCAAHRDAARVADR